MDLLVAGNVMAKNTILPSSGSTSNSTAALSTKYLTSVSYQVRMKMIDKSITPQNRIILCKAHHIGIGGIHDSGLTN